jgi:hypothetical protein
LIEDGGLHRNSDAVLEKFAKESDRRQKSVKSTKFIALVDGSGTDNDHTVREAVY